MSTNHTQLFHVLDSANHLLDKAEVFLLVLTAHDQATLEAYDLILSCFRELKKSHQLIKHTLSQ